MDIPQGKVLAGTPKTTSKRPETVNQMIDAYLTWADGYYRKPSGRPTREALNLNDALRALRQVAGERPPQSLQAEDLYAAQETMITEKLARTTINSRINRIRRFVRWCCNPPRRWIPKDIAFDLALVEPLRRGRSTAIEREPVKPVEWEMVTRTIANADLELATMIELHWWTGMRPGELVSMTRSTLKRIGDLLIYEPLEHKTQHHGQKRVIAIGPNGQAVLEPWLRRIPKDREPLFRFNVATYRQALQRINARHGIPQWKPNQIRHSYATRLRSIAGIEAARINLGHAHVRTTEIYAERDQSTAWDVVRKHC